MRIEDCFELGIISRTHGNNGGLVCSFDTDQPDHYIKLESVLLEIDGELVPFFIRSISKLKQNQFLIAFEDIDYQAACRLLGIPMYLPLTMLPPLSGKQFYFHEVENFTVIDEEKGKIGTITEVLERPPQPLFVITAGEKDVYLPAIDDFIERIDRKERTIYVNFPEGLLDIYVS